MRQQFVTDFFEVTKIAQGGVVEHLVILTEDRTQEDVYRAVILGTRPAGQSGFPGHRGSILRSGGTVCRQPIPATG